MEVVKMTEEEYLADVNIQYLLYGQQRQDQLIKEINELFE